jgi:hypothetical protein
LLLVCKEHHSDGCTPAPSFASLQVNEAVVQNLGALRSSIPFLKVAKTLGNDLSGR